MSLVLNIHPQNPQSRLIKQVIDVLDLDSMVRNRSREGFMAKFSKDLKRFRENWVGTSMESKVKTLLADAEKY